MFAPKPTAVLHVSPVRSPTHSVSSRTLVVVRHGITDWNAEERLQGHIDVPLNEEGIGQARALRDSLASFDFNAIYSSPLSRAKQTAEIVADRSKIRYDWRLAEINHGIWQGMTKKEIASRWPDGWALWQRNPNLYTPDGGESLFALEQRVRSFLQELEGSTILCVTHGQVIQTFFMVLQSRPVEELQQFSQQNAKVCVFNLQ